MTEQAIKETVDKVIESLERIRKLAFKVLPKGDENQTETERLIRSCTPDTYEWFETKFSLIFSVDDIKEFLTLYQEWLEYVEKKANEYIETQENYIEFQRAILDRLGAEI